MTPPIVLPLPPTDEETTFRTYRGYLEAVRIGIGSLCPHSAGFLTGLAVAVKGGGWPSTTATGRTLSPRSGQFLRNAWATEVLLNAPRQVGGADLITFANHWAVVQAYYAVFEGLNAVALTVGLANPPTTHASMLRWAGSQLGSAGSPFPTPWTCRVSGAPMAYRFEGFPASWTRTLVSNIAGVGGANCLDFIALALKTTRDGQIRERRPDWLKGLKTQRGAPRKTLPKATLIDRASKLAPTTLFDLLYRLRIRSNYQEADAFLRGALSSADAEAFHRALCDVVAATLLTIEIYLAHQVGVTVLERELAAVRIPPVFRSSSAVARRGLW